MCIKMSFLRCAKKSHWCIEVQLHVRCQMFIYILIYNHESCIISQYGNRSYINKQNVEFVRSSEHLVKCT